MELHGRIVRVLGESAGTNQQGNPWRKFEVIFGYYETPSDIYERNILLSWMNDRVDQYKGLQENDKVKVRVSLGCREYPQGSGKYFNDIRTGDLTVIIRADGGTVAAPAPQQAGTDNAPFPPAVDANGNPQNQEGEKDDLPF